MGLRINNNIAAMNSYRNLQATDKAQNSSLEKLSSGLRINKAADDAAGLSISEGLRAQIGGLKVAVRNAQDGVNVVQTADGALTETHSILQRMRDLAVQSANGGAQNTVSQGAADKEFAELSKELDDISGRTKFNGQALLDGSFTAKAFQVGSDNGQTLSVSIGNMSASTLGVYSSGTSSVSLATTASASAAIATIDSAIGKVSEERSKLGATQNRFEHKINNLNVSVENLTASESQIRDTDMAQEMTKFTRNQILAQAGTSMLAQANQASQNVLSLLG
ncbi:flagellin [Kineococcus sp. R8]|uniref:flagellin N-terminal helical domain-containing protein n=1 Tax=Kineococcus siccus TaxID=2696567 RepID=UPI0014121ECE|nr:flagellin [Kineococcus siccus]NAZ81461.1 flagellin [Kineococcus siccus]NAZ81462.1 flagellin [Kineococcus siccus]